MQGEQPVDKIKEFLRSSELFENLTDDELDQITALCREEVYELGTTVFKEGDIGRALYIVEEGKVVIEMRIRLGPGPGRQGAIYVIARGEGFGWWGGEPAALTMSARCIEKTTVIAIDVAKLWHLLEDNPSIGYKVMKRLVGAVSSRFIKAVDTLAHVLSIASHDLKAPLAAVESYHKVMLDGYAGEVTEKQKTMLLRSSERIIGLLNLIDNILDISRIDSRQIKMEDTSLLKVVENTRGVVQPLAEEKGVKLKIEVPEELPLVAAAPERLQQVFTNLMGNAVKFTPEGGTVTLKVNDTDDHIQVEVMDTGTGIPPEELPRIFDDFYRGAGVNSTGAGLGLSIARKIIEAHGGRIWAESPCPESGTGSRFTFTLPKSLTTTHGKKEEV